MIDFSVPLIDVVPLGHRYDRQVPQSSILDEDIGDLGRQAMLGYPFLKDPHFLGRILERRQKLLCIGRAFFDFGGDHRRDIQKIVAHQDCPEP